MRTSNRKQILIFSIFIILLAQISIDVFASNFRVSLGVLLLPILVYLYRSIAVLRVTVLAGFGVYLSRVFIRTLTAGVDSRAFADYYPELIFYIVYGCLFYLYFHKHDYKLPHPRCYVALFLMDYLANLSELLCRMGLDAFGVSLQFDIIVVALVRTLILWAVITGLSQYRFLLISTEHANRYQRLILLISKLNSEIIWMRKNSAMIEDAMAKSYRLYAQLQEQHASPELTQSALTVAKDMFW